MVVLAPSSSRNPLAEARPGEPDCMRASLPSRVLEERLRMGRGLASTLCMPSADELSDEEVVSSWSDVRRWLARKADLPLRSFLRLMNCDLVGVEVDAELASRSSSCSSSSSEELAPCLLQLELVRRR